MGSNPSLRTIVHPWRLAVCRLDPHADVPSWARGVFVRKITRGATATDIPISEKTLERLEGTVRNGLAAFVEVGNALVQIREGKGYKLRGYDTFENYCEEKFGFSDRHGRRMIVAAQTAGKVKEVVGAAPVSESAGSYPTSASMTAAASARRGPSSR